jgi:hypothetical protein
VIQNHFFLGAFLVAFAFLAPFCLLIGFFFPPAAFLVEAFLPLAGDLAGDEVAAGAVTGAGAETGVEAAGLALLTLGLAAVFGLLFEADFFDSDLFCCLAILFYFFIIK